MSSSDSAPGSLSWKEFVPLTGITSHLPKHFQHGLISSELLLTCLASFDDHIILGTNAGLVYLSHLPTLQTVRLKCEKALTRTCCLSAVRSLDDLVAAGDADGCVTVFLLPRLLHRSSGPAPRAGVGQDLKRFSVSSLHSAAITSLSWSVNGLRLVSGDATGGVGLLELDYDQCQCVGRRLLTESAPVVQLDYWKQAVAVSTEERCIVYSVLTGEVVTVGTKARKGRGRYGAAWQRAKASVGTLTEAGEWRDKGGHVSCDATNQSASNAEKNKLLPNISDKIDPTCNSNPLQHENTEIPFNNTLDQTESTVPVSTDNSVDNSTFGTVFSGGTSSADVQQPRRVLPLVSNGDLYTSRPGQRVWQADSSGSVHATMLIKDIVRARRIHVPDDDLPDDKNMDTPTSFRFEVIHTMDSGLLIMHSSDSLVIFNSSTLCVESYIYSVNFIRDVSINGGYIFILSNSSKLYCLSCRPLNLGHSAISLNKSSDFLEPPSVSPTLKKLGNKLYEQSSSLLGSVARLSGAIASRVSETAAGGGVVTGHATEQQQQQQQYSRNLSGELNLVTKQRLVMGPYCLQTQRRHSEEGLLSIESSDLSTNRLVQSLYEQLPGTPDPTKQVEPDTEFEPPLVVQGKVRPNHRRKEGNNHSPPAGSERSFPSAISSTSAPPSSAPAPSDPASVCSILTPVTLKPFSPRSEEAASTLPVAGLAAPGSQSSDTHLGNQQNCESERAEENKLSLRTLENERKLGFLLDIDCLKNTCARKEQPSNHEDFEKTLDNHLNTCEHSDSRDITVNDIDHFYCERKPPMSISENLSGLSLTEVTSNSDLTAANITFSRGPTATSLDSIFSDYNSSLCYGPPSGSSVPSLQSFSSSQILYPGNTSSGSQLYDVSSDQDPVTLTFEDAGVTEARTVPTSVDREFSTTDASQVKKKVIDGEWEHIELPSCLKALTSSDDLLVFVDGKRALYVGQVQERSSKRCLWGRAALPFVPSSVAVSASGNTLWLVDNNSIYVALRQHVSTAAVLNDQPVRAHEPLKRTDDDVNSTCPEVEEGSGLNSNRNCDNQVSSLKYLLYTEPVASKALTVCGDDHIMFYIKDDCKVYWRVVARGGREAPLHDDGNRFVSLSCRQGLLWGLDTNAALLFRIGQCESNPLGIGWGEITSDSRRATNGVSLPGSEEESSSSETGSRDNSFCLVDNRPTDEEAPVSYDEALRNAVGPAVAIAGELPDNKNGRRRNLADRMKQKTCVGRMTDVNANNPVGDDDPGCKSTASDATSVLTSALDDRCSAAVCLGSGGVGWRVTKGGRVQFRPGVSAAIPQGANTSWWQVAGTDNSGGGSSNCQLASTTRFLWRAEKDSATAALHPVHCQGSVWSGVGRERWSLVSAESLFGDQGALACLSPTGQLMMVNPSTAVATPVPLPDPSPALSVCQRPEVLWMLSSSGAVWVRAGLSATAVLGSHWQQLDLHQISDVHLCHLTLGTEVTWAVDTRGGVYMRQGSLDPPHPSACPQAWLQVDNVALPAGAVISKVFAGPAQQLVWALDSHQRVLVRVAIFPELPIGVAWEYVPGVRALQLSISEDGFVYCLTVQGAIYRREGVNPPHNYVGTSWVRLPGSLARLSVSVDGRLWGLDDTGRLLRHRCLHSMRWRVAFGDEGSHEGVEGLHEGVEGSQEEDWEVV